MADEKKETGVLLDGGQGIEVSSEMLDKLKGKKPKNPANNKTTRMKAPDNGEYSVIRDFPSYIVRAARAAFPKAKNNTDALVAYMAVMIPSLQDGSDFNVYATDSQKDLVSEADSGLYSDLSDRMLSFKKKLDQLAASDIVVKVMLYLLISDRYPAVASKLSGAEGFGRKDITEESLGPYMEELYRLSTFFEKEAKEFGHRVARRDGRPLGF